MRNILILSMIISLVSCASMSKSNHITHFYCDNIESVETINDTVYVKTIHIHTIYDCVPKEPINNDWIIMH